MEVSQLSADRLFLALLAILGLSLIFPQAAYSVLGSALGAAIAAITILALVRWHEVKWRGLSRPAAWALLVAAAWSAWWLIGWAFISDVPVLGAFAVGTVLQSTCVFVAFLALFALLPADWNLRPLVAVGIVAAAVLVSLHAMYQILGPAWMPYTFAARIAMIEAQPEAFSEASREGILHALREARASGVFGSPNVLAGYLAMALPLAIVYAFARIQRQVRITFAICACILLIGIVMTGSRGGLLGGMIGIMAVLTLMAPRWIAKGTTTALLMVVMLGAASSSGIFERWTSISTVQQRFLYWDAAMDVWSQAPLTGHGPGGFELHYPLHRDPRANETRYAHNWFFQWGSEVGAIGLALFVLWMGIVLGAGLVRWREARARDPLTVGLIAALVVLLCHGLVEFTLSIRELTMHLALIAALILSAEGKPATGISNRVGMVGAWIGALLFAGAWWWFQFAPSRAEYFRELAGYESPADDIRHLSRAIRWQPGDPALWESRAFSRLLAGMPGARDDMAVALALNPRSSRLHESMGRVEWAANNREEAMRLQREAMRLHPADPDRRLIMAEYLLQSGDFSAAREMVQSTDDMLWTRTSGLAHRADLLQRITEAEDLLPDESAVPVP